MRVAMGRERDMDRWIDGDRYRQIQIDIDRFRQIQIDIDTDRYRQIGIGSFRQIWKDIDR